MADTKTDWFPMETPPVNSGTYEVTVMKDLASEYESLAEWGYFLGQWGFWEVETWVNRYKKTLLNVSRWRGRTLPHRVPLLPEKPSGRDRRRLV